MAIAWRARLRELGVLVAIGTFLTFMNPFNSVGGLPFIYGWLFWTGLIIYGSIVGTITVRLIANWLPVKYWWGLFIIAPPIIAAFVTPAIMGILWMGGAGVPWSYVPRLFGFTYIISLAMTGMGFLMDRAGLSKDSLYDEEADNNGTARDPEHLFLQRLPARYAQADLYAVESEDHYLRIHTSLGQELILMRLSDAVRELESMDGVQTHRSWWVARKGVASVSRTDGKVSLTLHNDAVATVSRPNVKRLKEDGWLD